MNKKNLYQFLSIILVTALVLPVLPAKIIKAEENSVENSAGEETVVTPAAITAMAEDSNTVLNLMDGIITVTDQSYVQKTSGGTIVSQGIINGELVLTGMQSSSQKITVNGSNIPTIRFKNAWFKGNIDGTASGMLNIIIDGDCTLDGNMFATGSNSNVLSYITQINITGEEENTLGSSDGCTNLDSGYNVPILQLAGLNFTGTIDTDITYGFNLVMSDCTAEGGVSILRNQNKSLNNPSAYYAKITNCEFLSMGLNTGSSVTIDNVRTEQASESINAGTSSPDNVTIKDSYLTEKYFFLQGQTNKITNSTLIATDDYSSAPFRTGTVLLEGSTLIDSGTETYNYATYNSQTVIVMDSSLIFKGDVTAKKRFYYLNSSNLFDPIDSANKPLFLNKLKVPGASNSYVTVSIDGRDEVNLGTDPDGYLHLYLKAGEHSVRVIDVNGIVYEKTFEAINTRETAGNPNIAGELEPARESTNIITPYRNAEIQYSFDNNNWNNAVTDEAGYFRAVIPDNAVRIYIKLVETGENKYAIILHGTVGEFYEDKPVITEQSSPDLTVKKGLQGTVYVTSEPYIIGDTLTYQWYKDGKILSGKTSPVLHLSAPQISDAGTYTCIITESDGRTVTSIPITVTVDESRPEEEGVLTIISQSTGKTLIQGYSTELYVNAKPSLSTKTLIYQWFKDGEEIAGAADSKLSLNAVWIEDSGSYVCRIYEDSNYIDSAPIPVTVEENPLEDDVADLMKQVSDLISQVETLTGQLDTAQQEKETLQNTIDGLESQIGTYINLIRELQRNITDLEQQLADTEEDKETLNQMITDLNNQILNLNHQISVLQADLEAANDEKETLVNIVMDLNNDIINLNSQITLFEDRLADSEEANTELKNQVTELHNTISGLETEATYLQYDINSLTEQNNQLINQVETLTNQNAALEDEIQRLQDLLDAANSTISNLTKQVNDLTSEVNTLTDQLNTANGDKAALQDTIINLENQITTLNGQIDGLNGHVSELEAALEQEGADKNMLNQTIIELNIQITTLYQTVTNLQNQLDSVTEEKNSLQNTVTGLNNRITDLNNQIAIITNKLKDSEAENTQLVNQVTELKNTMSGLKSDIANLQGDLETLNNSNAALQGQLDTANDTINSLNALLVLIKGELGVSDNEDIIPAIQQLKAQLQQEEVNNTLLQEQLEELNTELDMARDYNSVLITKLQKLMHLAGAEDVEGIKDKIIELQNSLTESESRVIELEKEKNDLINGLQEAENLNKSLQQKIDELLKLGGSDAEELKKQVLDLTEQIKEMIQNNQKLQESVNHLDSQVTDLNSEKVQLESEIVRLETLLNTANSTIEELRQQLADMAAGKTNLENENSALKKEIENLKQQLESSKHHSGSSNNRSNTTEVNELKDKLEQALEDLENTKKELEQLQQKTGVTDGTQTGNTDNTDNSGNSVSTEIKIPENSMIVLPVETVGESVIKEPTDKPIKKDKIEAEEGWEIAPTLESQWAKEIDLVETLGQTNKEEQVEYSFYAREEDKPEQIYSQTVTVEKPVAIPNFTMDKLIYLGSEFQLNVVNITDNTKVIYQSEDSSVAKISKSGIITPVKEGKTQITGTVIKNNIPYQFTVNITVKDGENRTLNLKDQAIQTSANEPVLVVYKLINKGKTTKINLNAYAKDAIVSYISADSSIASVNKDGIIKGIKKGSTAITATLVQNNTIYKYVIKVRVDDGTKDMAMWEYLKSN